MLAQVVAEEGLDVLLVLDDEDVAAGVVAGAGGLLDGWEEGESVGLHGRVSRVGVRGW